MISDKLQILKVLVGSRAHCLHNEDSDYDYRGVYVNSTEDILSLGHKYKGNHWVEGESVDQTSYEIGHFLLLATKCNATILEVFKAPRIIKGPTDKEADKKWRGVDFEYNFGTELRKLFPYIWNPNDAFNAFAGYATNQRKKMLDKKDNRAPKFATAYLRTIKNLEDLLETGTFRLEVPKGIFKEYLLSIRNGDFKPGEVIDIAEEKIEICKLLRDMSKQEPDLQKVHDFLMKVRKHYWEL